MDVSELLNFHPQKPVLANEETNSAAALTKPPRPTGVTAQERNALVLEELEQTKIEEPLNETSIRKMTSLLEKKASKNQEMRIKYADTPNKFMQSELDLNDAIQEFSVVAADPSLYQSLVDEGGLRRLVNLIVHENTDIGLTVANVLQELTDVDFETDAVSSFIKSLVSMNCLPNVIGCIRRLDESVREDADGVHDILSIIENIFDLEPGVVSEAAIDLKLLEWLLARIKTDRPFDNNKLFASEILSICAQQSDRVKLHLAKKLMGIDTILQQLAVYKRADPQSPDETEFMENMFGCLCSILLVKETHPLFLAAEGLQLMNLMIRERKLSRYGALKTLSFVLNGIDSSQCCQKYVDILGLRVIFPLLMKAPKADKRIGITHDENEERVLCIVHALVRNSTGMARQRILLKFTEDNYEKIERMVELHLKYAKRVQRMDESKFAKDEDGVSGEMAGLLRRMENGMLTHQLIDSVLIELSVLNRGIIDRLIRLCAVKNINVFDLCNVVRGYAETFEGTIRSKEKELLRDMVKRFEHELS